MTIYKCDMCHKEVPKIWGIHSVWWDASAVYICKPCAKEVSNFITNVAKGNKHEHVCYKEDLITNV